jgi:hypothetical protein
MAQPDWKWYENKIAELFRRVKGTEVEQNVTEVGQLSKSTRQIDIRILAPHDIEIETQGGFRIPITVKIIVDCKHHGRPIDVSVVGEVISLKEDVGAHMGIVVSPEGITTAARTLALSKGVFPVVATHDLIAAASEWERDDWETCRVCEWEMEDGIANYIDWRHDREGHCNRCNTLHVRCPECHEVFGISEDEYGKPLGCPYDCGSAFYVELLREDHEIVPKLRVFDMLECALLSAAYAKPTKRITRREYSDIVAKTRWQYWEEGRPEICLTEDALMEWGGDDCLHITSDGVRVFKRMIANREYPVCY